MSSRHDVTSTDISLGPLSLVRPTNQMHRPPSKCLQFSDVILFSALNINAERTLETIKRKSRRMEKGGLPFGYRLQIINCKQWLVNLFMIFFSGLPPKNVSGDHEQSSSGWCCYLYSAKKTEAFSWIIHLAQIATAQRRRAVVGTQCRILPCYLLHCLFYFSFAICRYCS